MKTIDPKPLAESNQNGQAQQILDVRTPAEFEQAHISGSKLSPLDSLDPDQIIRNFDTAKPLFVICQSGKRAKQAVEKLQQAGCESAVLLNGGINAWSEHSLPLNTGKKTMSLERQVRIAAGILILTGAVLGFYQHPLWHLLSAFVGAGLTFAGITDSCAMGMLIAKMPWNRGGKTANECMICTS